MSRDVIIRSLVSDDGLVDLAEVDVIGPFESRALAVEWAARPENDNGSWSWRAGDLLVPEDAKS